MKTLDKAGWRVLKFGGTSVRDAGRIRHVASLVSQARQRSERVAVVVSALGGATDQLLQIADAAEPSALLAALEQRHREAAEAADQDSRENVERLLGELRALRLNESAQREAQPDAWSNSLEQRDELLSYGERLSSVLVASALRAQGLSAQAVDLRPLVRTDSSFGAARVQRVETRNALAAFCSALEEDAIPVCTGFLGSDRNGQTTTLGRGGSDLSAALLGEALEAEEIEIWTDVDGVLSADPRVVPNAFSIEQLSYNEVMELAHFGAKVLYPPTVAPARAAAIPLSVRNTLNPEFPGTRICDAEASAETNLAASFTGITSIADVAMLTLRGPGMLGVTGTAERFFGALARADCNVILISQASSEHAICCAVEPHRAAAGCAEVDAEFERERSRGQVRTVVCEPDLSVVAVVGEGMREHPGIAGRVFSVLGGAAINVRAIAQGCSERNISMVVAGADREAAVGALHRDLFEGQDQSATRPNKLGVVIAGVGGVGEEVVRLVTADERLVLRGVLSSRKALLAARPEGSLGSDWRDLLAARTDARSDRALMSFLSEEPEPVAVVDCTASQEFAATYPELLQTGSLLVAANKIGFAGDRAPADWFAAPQRVRFEATVGAGLPVLRTLHSLLDGGDVIHEISGVFSGTLGFLLSAARNGVPISRAVRNAFDAGYTEPDPRDDLSGADVARKLLILARCCGADSRLDDIELEPLLSFSDEEKALEVPALWPRLGRFDEPFEETRAAAERRGEALAYVAKARFDGAAARLSVGLESLPEDHPACQLSGSDNLFLFRTERYHAQPLAVRGPGAGTLVTAAGVLEDLLALHRHRCLG